MGDDGYATAELDGVPVSVIGGIDGEKVTAEIAWVAPDRFFARVTEVQSASQDRVQPPCEYFGRCTGCQWQHVSYERQLELKRGRVVMELRKYPELAEARVEPTLGSPKQLRYRNHARFTVAKWAENRGEAGYMSAVSRRFVRVDECLLMDDRINEALAKTQGKLAGMSQLSVRVGANTDSMLIQPELPAEIGVESGQTHYEEEVNGQRFRVASPSFFQVNTAQLERMAAEVAGMLRLDGSGTLLDAYSGVGTFAIMLAPYVDKVIAVEESASSVEDARANAAGIANIEFMPGRSEELMAVLTGQIDYVILDPPRVGCMPEALDAVARMRPRKVVVVSCEPSALARDLAILVRGGFTLTRTQPVDMFPQTRHVETLATLEMR
jgi:23S rRNA (uracil1939-C5)-methyltransferase